jgi:DNA-binding MarR family transcriptional regulator
MYYCEMNSSTSSSSDSDAPASTAPAAEPHAFYDGKGYTGEASVGWMLKRAHNSLLRSMDLRMQPYDLTAMQWGPLMLLAKGRCDTVAACAREADIDASAMTRMLDRLETKGLIRRTRNETDRRVVNVALTASGRDAAARIPQELALVLNHHLRGFTPEEFATLKTLLLRFEANGNSPV